MSILTQLRKLEKDLTGYKTQGETALKSYQDLYPKYKTAVTAAQDFSPKVVDAYNVYAQKYNEGVALQKTAAEAQTERNRLAQRVQGALNLYNFYKQKIDEFGPRRSLLGNFYNAETDVISRNYQLTQYETETFNPATQAYQNFVNTGEVDRLQTNYETLNTEYEGLKSAYKGIEESLSVYTAQMQEAAERSEALGQQIPGLQRSLKVEQDPRKRETRIGYGRSLMTSGTKRRSSVR